MEFINQINTMLTDRFGELGPMIAIGLGFWVVSRRRRA